MSAEKFLGDAHEVYARWNAEEEWEWMATFATERLAFRYAETFGEEWEAYTEVRPV